MKGLASCKDVAVGFTWEERQDLNDAQRTLHSDVMLETYSVMVSLGHCITKPEALFRLEQGAERHDSRTSNPKLPRCPDSS